MKKNTNIFKPLVLIILDGFGVHPDPDYEGNAVKKAHMPNFKRLWRSYEHTQLQASGKSVGLPRGQDGSSQVGHLNIGSGRVVYQDLEKINHSILDEDFFENKAFIDAINHVKTYNSQMHLVGVLEQSAVHASMDHFYALLTLMKAHNVHKVFIHAFTDGRDDPPHEGATLMAEVEQKLDELSLGKVATVSGRFYAMDRDNRWERTELAYNCIVHGQGKKAKNSQDAILNSYGKGESDEFIKPTNIVDDEGKPVGLIEDNDAVIFFNHRVDRVRQLCKAFVLPSFDYVMVRKDIFDERYPLRQRKQLYQIKTFDRGESLKNLYFVTMTRYEKGLPVSAVAYPRYIVKQTLAEVISDNQKRQLHITETEKERFVTYYFNGMREDPYPLEDRIIIPSPSVKTYDLQPEMSAHEITEILVQKIRQKLYDFIVVNFANPDMVGHTGILDAGIKACETVDACLGKIIPAVQNENGAVILTADHGNVEEMVNEETGEPDTEHSSFPVPFIYIDGAPTGDITLEPGILADIAPTILKLMKIPVPSQMTGKSLLNIK